jgi:hypothetical protein
MDPLSAGSPAYRCFPRSAAIIPHIRLAVLASAMLLAGCDRSSAVSGASVLPADAAPVHRSPDVLRVRVDTVRNRTWVLALGHIDVYDRRTWQLIRRIELPPWSVAAFICQPDIAIDAGGTAFISHNLEPKLWTIHADNFELQEHTFRLLGKEHLDIGFSSLSVAPDGTLMGKASVGGSVWRIDLHRETAVHVEPVGPPRAVPPVE